jgi:hypothetical protein
MEVFLWERHLAAMLSVRQVKRMVAARRGLKPDPPMSDMGAIEYVLLPV